MQRPSLLAVALLAFAVSADAQSGQCLVETFAGGGTAARGDGGPALEAEIHAASDIQFGPEGLVYVSEYDGHRIRRITDDGRIETVAGTGEAFSSGDGGPALEAGVWRPASLAFGPDGSLYVLENEPRGFEFLGNMARIRRIAPDGVIETVAGGSATGITGDKGPALGAGLSGTNSISVGPDGSIYLIVESTDIVRRISPEGVIDRFAGSGARTGPIDENGVPAVEARLFGLTDARVGPDGAVYLLESNRIRRVSAEGVIELYLGGGSSFGEGASREDAAFAASGGGLDFDSQGRLYYNTNGGLLRVGLNNRIERVTQAGRLGSAPNYAATAERVVFVRGHQAFDVSDGETVHAIAGALASASRGDGGPATEAAIGRPLGLAYGPNGSIHIADVGFSRLRRVRDGVITTTAGTGATASDGDGGPAVEAAIGNVQNVAVGPAGVFVQDGLYVVRLIRPDGTIEPYVGGAGLCGQDHPPNCGDGGPAVNATTNYIRDIAADSRGNLFILSDERRSLKRQVWIRVVTRDGVINTLPDPLPGYGPARAIAVDADDNLLIAFVPEVINAEVWRRSPDGEFSAIENLSGFFRDIDHLAVDEAGDLYLSDGTVIVRASPDGEFRTLLADRNPYTLHQGDGGPLSAAYLGAVAGMAVGGGSLYVADLLTTLVRRVDLTDCPIEPRPRIFSEAVRNGASFTTQIAPGTLISIFGRGLGPDGPVGARIEDGALTTELGGTRVLVNGRAAPMVFASEGQINAILPWSQPVETSASLQVEHDGVISQLHPGHTGIFVRTTAPALFTFPGDLAAALNQDGSVNGPNNPAAPGSIVVLFGTGAGATEPPSQDGVLASGELPRPVAPLTLTVADRLAEILYAGAAPGLVSGVLQVNARIPVGVASGRATIRLRVGDNASPAVDVWVAQ